LGFDAYVCLSPHEGAKHTFFRSIHRTTFFCVREADVVTRTWRSGRSDVLEPAETNRNAARVERGEVIGYVGDTGNAQPGDYHLHFSVAILDDADRWWQGRMGTHPRRSAERIEYRVSAGNTPDAVEGRLSVIVNPPPEQKPRRIAPRGRK
jgi:hypothetical protein